MIEAGRSSITFASGSAVNSYVLTKQYIFNSEVGSREGTRVATSVGRFVTAAIRQTRVEPVFGTSS